MLTQSCTVFHPQVMALTVVELGNILAAEPGTDIQMYHDPGKGTDMEGRSSKQLKIQSAPDGKVHRRDVSHDLGPRQRAHVLSDNRHASQCIGVFVCRYYNCVPI